MRIFSRSLLCALSLALLSPVFAFAEDSVNTGDASDKSGASEERGNKTIVLEPARENSSPSLDPLSQELKKKSKRLRFRDGPLCLCADGLQEKDIKKAKQNAGDIDSSTDKNGTEKQTTD
ncbi:MAG: hypothetical protein AAGC78_10870 [Cellvibrio sp.]|uniref:hypothetical protein n=1 Tax=Cellvibrio sp. TaxID=1965322 RepID=UPI0031A52564